MLRNNELSEALSGFMSLYYFFVVKHDQQVPKEKKIDTIVTE